MRHNGTRSEGAATGLPHPAGETETLLDRAGGLNGGPRLQQTGGGHPCLDHVLAAQAEASIDGILVVDGQGEIVFANRRFSNLWGFPEATILTGSDAPLLQMALERVVDPEGFRTKVEHLYRHPEETSRDEVALKDGRVFDRYSAPIFGPDGRPGARVWFFHDVTRRARAEADLLESRQSLEAIINSIADPVFVKTANRRFSLANDALCAIVGAPREAILGKCDADFFPPEQVSVFRRQDDLVFATGIPDVNEELITGAGGEVRTIVTKKTLHTDSAGQKFIVGVIRDVTEQARAARFQRMARQRAQALLELFRLPRTSEKALVAFALDRLVALTGSELGFIGFMDTTETTMSARPWSARAVQECAGCAMCSEPIQFDVRTGGFWADAIRQHQAVIVNDPVSLDLLKKACPAGRVQYTRLLAVPLIRDGRAVLVAGLGNKAEDYGELDEVGATLLLEGVWELIGRNRAERGLIQSQAQLDEVGAMTGGGGWELDLATRVLSWASEAYRICEIPESGGIDLAKASLFIDPPGRSTFEAAMKRCMESGEPFDLSLPMTSAKGGHRWVRVMAYRVKADGKVVRLAGTFQDITARKRAEARIATLVAAVEQTADDSILLDLGGRIEYVNPAFERTTGYSSAEAMGRDVNDLLCRGLDEALLPQIWESIRAGHPWKGRFSNRTKDGRVILLDASVSAIRDPSGAIIGYVSARRDVTKQLEMEAHLAQADKLEAIGTLAGGIAHDFNNVLSAIVGNSQLALMKCADDAPVRRDLEVVLQGARRATTLVKQILTFSRHTQHEEGPVQLGLIVKEASRFLRATVPTTIEIRTDVQSTSLVLADPTEIHRIIINLCTNAVLAMNERGGLLEIGLADVDTSFAQCFPGLASGKFLRLRVRDTGHGMSRDVLERIFEPFFTTREVGKGTGMGLAVVHGIVASLRGSITVKSEPGAGTTFEVHLPVAEKAVPVALAPSKDDQHGTERVLLVDDDPLVLETVAEMLRELGYQVRSETSWAIAQATFEADPQAFDLVITDMTMPGMTGDVLAERLKGCRPDIPIILCSGYTEEQMPEGTRVQVFDEFLLKPLFLEPLSRIIRKVLDGSRRCTHSTEVNGAPATNPSAMPPA
jgi:PAS domain S-box-containing protein